MPSNAETFAKYLNQCFVETGSFEGDGIQAALDAGFPRVISIELAPKYCDLCRERFRGDARVEIVHGDSSKVLWDVIKAIDCPITFWLDGHWSRGDTALGEQETPLMLELGAISRHPIKTHTILIDDLRMWSVDNPDIGFGEAELAAALLEINPEYCLSHENGYHFEDVFVDDILVARVATGREGNVWRIYVVTHRPPVDWMYAADPQFGGDNYSFLNVSDEPIRGAPPAACPLIDLSALSGSAPIGAHYAESEAVYGVYRSSECLDGLDYVGFLHWDKELKTLSGETDVTARIISYVSRRPKAHISFETHRFSDDYNQRILADETQPDVFVGGGKNCYDYILDDYNAFFGTSHALSELEGKGTINLCSCFLVDIETFEKMMAWCADVIDTRRLDVFDGRREHRLQGGLLERYYGVFLSFEFDDFLDLTLHHHYQLKHG